MVKFYIVLFVFLIHGDINAQSYHSTFTLEGHINVDTGKIKLLSYGGVYPPNKATLVTSIVNGKFSFSDSILYPYAFRLIANSGPNKRYISDIFIIDSGTQKIQCHFDSLREVPGINNESMREMNGAFKEHYLPVENALFDYYNKKDSLDRLHNNKPPLAISTSLSDEYIALIKALHSNLLSYTKNHPNSFVALWKLSYFFEDGYEPIYDSIFGQFSVALKNTYTGKELAKQLASASIVKIGNRFPQFLFLNTKNKKEIFSIDSKKKYTLVDFWFSHCGPCLSEFRELKNLFEKYNDKGFDIKGISIDNKENIVAWKNVINQYKLPWKQYLDLNSSEAGKLNIDAYPTNFLLNEKGEIIEKNIQPDELKKLLEDKL